jgi:hypothetical protein
LERAVSGQSLCTRPQPSFGGRNREHVTLNTPAATKVPVYRPS